MFVPTSFRSLALLFSFCLAATAQPIAEKVRSEEGGPAYARITISAAPTGSIAGKVVNDPDTGDRPEGVAGVRVFVRSVNDPLGARLQHQISGAAGHFNFDSLGVGKYVVTIDPISIPTRFRMPASNEWTIEVGAQVPATIDLPVIAERVISGTVFVDKDGNGEYKPGKDAPVEGALITVGGAFAVTKADGSYSFRDMPAGRLALLVEWPGRDERTQVLLYLPSGPVKNRIVNIARER